MPKTCPSCQALNDDDLTTCFTCGHSFDLATPAILQGSIVGERYEILGRLGKGGMGVVYRAHDRVLDEEVALKVLRDDFGTTPDLGRRFRSEIKLARKVVHRNVSRIYEYGESGGRRFISMELIQGTDLKQRLRQLGQLDPRRACAILLQVAEGLRAIHEAGIIHRDLKTPNVMIDAKGTVRLMDFGIAKEMAAADGGTGSTGTGTVVGTPDYMSPEQARGERLDFRSDIYSLGVLGYELLTGQLPFQADTPVALLLKHIHEPPPLDGPQASRIPVPLVPVLRRAMAKDPSARFQNVGELVTAWREACRQAGFDIDGGVDDLAAGAPVTRAQTMATPVPAGTPAPTAARPARFRPIAIAAVLLVAFLALLAVVRRQRDAPESDAGARAPLPTSASSAAIGTAASTVRINALPWARVRFSSGPAGFVPPALTESERTTPLVVTLPPGVYAVELENGGLTSPLVERVEVRAGGPVDLSFRMPGFDPEAAVTRAMASR